MSLTPLYLYFPVKPHSFYSIINHILQATCKCFAVVQFSFQVLVMTDMLALD